MANSLLKLTVESSEYDAKLKKAAEGIRHLADVAHKSGGDLTGLEKAELDFIKDLGDMETKSRSAAGQVRELENTYKELKVIYEQLNEVEKADEGGKALAASLEQLKQRAQDAKKSLEDASKSLQENADAGKEDSSVLAQLASKFTINIDAIKLFNVGLQAAKAALDVAKDAFFASETNVDEWGRTMAASQSLYEGFLTAINNGDISGYLSRMDEIVQAARAAYNELDTLGTMKTIQAPKMSAQQTENERFRMMIQTGRYIAPVDGRKASMKDGQLLTPEQIKTLERQLQNGMKSVVKLVGNEVKQTGKAINAYYNSIAKQNGMSLQEFKKGTSSWDEFSKKMQGYQQYQKWRQENSFTDMYGNRQVREGNPYQEFKKWGTFRVDKMGENSFNELVGLIRQRDQQSSQIYSTMAQSYRTMNRAEGLTVRQIMGGGSGGSGGGGKNGKNTNKPTYAADSIAAQQALVSELTKKWNEASQDMQQGYVAQLVVAEAKLREMKHDAEVMKDLAMGKFSGQGFGSIAEASGAFGLPAGITTKTAPMEARWLSPETLAKANREAQKTPKSKTTEKQEKSAVEVMSQMNSGINQIAGGIEGLGIKLPEELSGILGGINSMLSILQGITILVQGIAAIQEVGTFLGIIPGMARGGIVPHAANGYYVPGNSFSGDNTLIAANAGELILSKSAQGNLASMLNNGGLSNLHLETYLDGRAIRIVLNNESQGRLKGKYVTSNNVR